MGLARLTQYLIAKSVVEALFVGALAVSFYLTAFSPHLRGELDQADARLIKGWAVDQSAPQSRIEVQLYIDDLFVASRRADAERPDVMAAGLASDVAHGYAFETPPLAPGEHVARVYAVHESGGGVRRTLQLVGKPGTFRVGGP
jgi:hypothetical protein